MKRDVFIEIIQDFQEKPLPELVERQTELKIPTVKKTISVIGPRRAGKTYFIYNIIKDLVSHGIPKERMIYINLEDDRLLPLEVNDLDSFLRTFFEIHPILEMKKYIFFWMKFKMRIIGKRSSGVLWTHTISKYM